MINKIHVTEVYDSDLATVFKQISHHTEFLSGGGLRCQMKQLGKKEPNGDGAIREVITPKLTFEEKIFDFKVNQSFSYVIIKTTPKKPFKHHKGWIEFKQVGNQVKVDWHSHFEITVPIIGGVLGWFIKNAISKVFIGRMKYLKENSEKT